MPPTGPGEFSVGAAYSYAWNKFTQNVGPILIVMLILFALDVVISLIGTGITAGMRDGSTSLFGPAQLVSYVFNVLTWMIGIVVGAVIIKGALDLTAGRPLSFNSMTSGIDYAQVILAAFIIGVLVFIGLVLCILPGLVVIFMTWFTTYFIVGHGMNAMDAISASMKFVSTNFGTMLLLMLAGIGVGLLGVLACLIGLIVAYPVILLANTYAFRVLNNEPVAP